MLRSFSSRLMIQTRNISTLSLASASSIASKAIAEAERQDFAPITVTVIDPAGDVICTMRQVRKHVLYTMIQFNSDQRILLCLCNVVLYT